MKRRNLLAAVSLAPLGLVLRLSKSCPIVEPGAGHNPDYLKRMAHSTHKAWKDMGLPADNVTIECEFDKERGAYLYTAKTRVPV